MKAVFSPSFPFGEVFAPPSKSMAHRYLICGALSEQSRVSGLAMSEDIKATADCLKALGSRVDFENDTALVGGLCPKEEAQLDCRESGSTLRFMLPLALLGGKEITLTGSPRLMERGAGLYEQMCSEHGLFFENKDGKITVKGPLKPGKYSIDGSLSSQYFSGMLFALSTLDGDSELKVKGKLQSRPYVNMTIKALADFGVKIERIPGGFFIPGGQKFLSRYAAVEGDWSNAAFFLCMGALSPAGVCVEGLHRHSAQGDRAVLDILRKMGAEVTAEEETVTVRRGALRGVTIDARPIPDLIPVLSVLAALAEGETVIEHAGRLRLKESDRLTSTAAMLSALGGQVTELPEGLCIQGVSQLAGGTVEACNDHRIAMAAAVAAGGCRGNVIVRGSECVNKSYPDFWRDLDGLKGAEA